MRHISTLSILSLSALVAACGSTETARPVADAADTMDGTRCPAEFQLTLADYAETGLPAMGEAFLTENGARSGVVTTDSGLQYKVVQDGLEDGVVPTRNQQVEVLYHGYFPDGEVFDSAYERGSPISFAPGGVIAGWTEALMDMEVCEARTLYVPGNLAYGPQGRPGIPPNATLLFNVQMLGVQQ